MTTPNVELASGRVLSVRPLDRKGRRMWRKYWRTKDVTMHRRVAARCLPDATAEEIAALGHPACSAVVALATGEGDAVMHLLAAHLPAAIRR